MVVYQPSQRGQDLDVMSPPEQQLQKGITYKIAKVTKELYVEVEGYRHPGGGIHWTEFTFNGAIKKCPFKVGDVVVYSPTLRGRGQIIMTEYHALKHGARCKIVGIIDDSYLIVEGFENVSFGGVYWEEFFAPPGTAT